MSEILVGTASWTDKSLILSGRFYPPQVTTPEDRLRYYATQFPVVEVDSSYYAMPSEHNAQLWAERTPDAFVFDVKAFRLFTQHQTPPQALPKDIQQALGTLSKKNVYYRDMPEELLDQMWQRFETAIQPLKQAGKFSQLSHRTTEQNLNAPHLLHLAALGNIRCSRALALDFHASIHGIPRGLANHGTLNVHAHSRICQTSTASPPEPARAGGAPSVG